MIEFGCYELIINGVSFTSDKNAEYKLVSISNFIRNINVFASVPNIEISYPLSKYMAGSFVMPSKPQQKAQLLLYPSLNDLQNGTNRQVLIDGIVVSQQESHDAKNVRLLLKIGDVSSLAEQQHMDSTVQYSEVNFNSHIKDVLENNLSGISINVAAKPLDLLRPTNEQLSINVIPVRRGVVFSGDDAQIPQKIDDIQDNSGLDLSLSLDKDNKRKIPIGNPVSQYIESLCNEVHVSVFTNIYNNKECLYFLDTSDYANKIAMELYKRAGLGNEIQTIRYNYKQNNTFPYVLSYENFLEWNQIYNEIHIFREDDSENHESFDNFTKKTMTEKVSNLGYKITKDMILKMKYAFQLNKKRDGAKAEDDAEYLLRQIMANGITAQFTVKSLYCNYSADKSKMLTWQLACPITIDSDIMNKNPIFNNEIMHRSKDKWILAGYNLSYDFANGTQVTLMIMPNSFPFGLK